jgi:hypothetical protein
VVAHYFSIQVQPTGIYSVSGERQILVVSRTLQYSLLKKA